MKNVAAEAAQKDEKVNEEEKDKKLNYTLGKVFSLIERANAILYFHSCRIRFYCTVLYLKSTVYPKRKVIQYSCR